MLALAVQKLDNMERTPTAVPILKPVEPVTGQSVLGGQATVAEMVATVVVPLNQQTVEPEAHRAGVLVVVAMLPVGAVPQVN